MKRKEKKTKIIQSIFTNKEINSNRAEEIIKSAKIKIIMVNIIIKKNRERERERERERFQYLLSTHKAVPVKVKVNFLPRQNFFKLDLQFFNNEQEKEAYVILELTEEASEKEIINAYRRLSLKWHPDKNGNSKESTEEFQKINNACQTLINKIRREKGLTNNQEEWWAGKSYDELIEEIKELERQLHQSAEIGVQLVKVKQELEAKLEEALLMDRTRRETIADLSWQVDQSWKFIQNLNDKISGSENQIQIKNQDDFEEAIDNLNNKFQQLQDIIISGERKIADKNDRLRWLEKEISRQEETREEGDERIKSFQAQIEGLKKENSRLFQEGLNLKQGELENEIDRLKRSLENNQKVLKLELDDTKERLIEVNGLLDAKKNELDDLISRSAQLFADQGKENSNLITERDHLQIDLERIIGEYSKIVSERENWENKVGIVESEKLDLENQIDDLQQELKVANREGNNWEKKYRKLERGKDNLVDKIKAANEQIKELAKAGEEALKLLAEKNKQLEDSKKKKTEIKKELSKVKNNSSWKSTIKKIGIGYLAAWGTHGVYNWNQGGNDSSLTTFNSTINTPSCPNFVQNIYQNIPFNENENSLLQQLLNFPQNNEPITSTRKDLIVPDFQKEINRLEEGWANSRKTARKLRWKNQQVENDLNKELDKSLQYEKKLTDIKSLVGQLERKLAENEIVISDLQAQIDQQKSGRGLTVHGSGVNDLTEKITALEQEKRKLQKEKLQLRDELQKEQSNLLYIKNAYQNLEKEKNEWKTKYEKAELKPANLPDNWETELKKIPILETNQKPEDYDKIKSDLEEWNEVFDNKKPSDIIKQITELEKRPTRDDLNNAVKVEAEKYKDFIDPKTRKKLENAAKKAGFGFTQKDIDEAVETEKEKWTGYVDPKVYRVDWISPINLETILKNTNDTITSTQTHLGIDDLNNLPTLNGKTLPQLLADSNQLGQLSDILKNNFNLTDLDEWDKHLVKKEDLDNAKEQLKNYRDKLTSLGIIDLNNWLQQVQTWKNADRALKNLQNKLKKWLGLNDTNLANWQKEIVNLQNRLTQEQIDDKYQGWKSPQEITNEREEFERKINKLQREKQELSTKIEEIQTNLTQKERIINNLHSEVKKAEELDEKQKQEISGLRKEKIDLESKLNENQKNQNKEREKYQKELTDLRDKKIKSEKELWTQINNQEKQIEELTNYWQEKEANLNQKISQLNTELQLINTLISDKETLIKELKNKTQTLQTQLAQTKIDYESQITSLQLKVAANQQTLEDLKSKLKERDRILTNSKRQLEKNKDKLTTLRRQKRLGEKTLNRQIASLQRKSESEKNKLNEELENLRNSKLVSEEQLNQKIRELTEEIENLNSAYKKQKANYDKKLTELQKNLQRKKQSNWSAREGLVELVIGGVSYWMGSQTEADKLEEKIKETEKQKDSWQRSFQQEQQSKNQAETERDNKEKHIIQKLNTLLNLNLTNPTLKQVITKIKELINKPSALIIDNEKLDSLEKDLAQPRQTISRIAGPLQAQKPTTLLGEDLANIINLEKETN